MSGSASGSRKIGLPFLGKNRRTALIVALLTSITLLLAVAASASALTIGMNWRGNYSTEDLELAQRSGATVYHLPINYSDTHGGNWGSTDSLVEKAWKRDMTVLPLLIRTNSEGNRFLLPSDPDWGSWGSWAQEVVERYGVNGSFWDGKANPKPVTAWEIWNEPNFIFNNPKLPAATAKEECKALGQTFYEKEGTCIQPQHYGPFLSYTAKKVQAGSIAKTAHGTDVLFGGLMMSAGEGFEPFVTKAAEWGGLTGDVTGVAIHPYSFQYGKSLLEAQVNTARSTLDGLGVSGKTLWLTEMGWPTGGTEGFPAGMKDQSEAVQAGILTEAFDWIKSVAAAKKIELAAYFTVKDYSDGLKWASYCGLVKQNGEYKPAWYAFQKEAGVEPTGTQWTAFQANNGRLFTFDSVSGVKNTELVMRPGTDPSVALIPRGGAFVSFQAPTGELFYYSSTGGSLQMGYAMAANSSPSTTYVPGDGFVTAFETYNGELWIHSTVSGVKNTGLVMKPETSPSITTNPDGGYFVAFQAPTGELFYYSSSGASLQMGYAMAAKSSPSLTYVPGDGFVTAFETYNGELWTHSTKNGVKNTGLVMKPETSPSISPILGEVGHFVAFDAPNDELWFYSSTSGSGLGTGLVMAPKTSPSVDPVPGYGFLTDFQAYNNILFLHSTLSGSVATGLGMMAGTSPSMAVRP